MWGIARAPCDENIVGSSDLAAQCTKIQGRWILVATILASAMAFIDGTVVNVALPALQTSLNATALDLQWVIEAYSLLLSAFLLIGGSLGDHYGRRRIFVLGVIIFAVSSAACGLAATIQQLIAARAIQGFGAALLVPGSLAIISSSFAEQDRGRAIGTWSGFSAITTAIGPVMGGWFVEHFSWRAVFYINVPLAFLVVLISLRHVPENREREQTRIDWLGAFLATAGLAALIYALIESSRPGFAGHLMLSLLAIAAVLLTLFLFVESRSSHPMLPLTLFRSRTFTGANLLTFLLYAALGGSLFFFPLNLIQVQHYSPAAAGAALLPFIVVLSLLSRWAGGLLLKYGARAPLIIGPIIASLGFALFALPGIGGSYWSTFFPAVAVLGLGMAVCITPLTTTVMNAVPPSRSGIASGVNNAVARSAGLIAIAVLGIVMVHIFGHQLDARLTQANLSPAVIDSLHTQRTLLAAAEARQTDSAVHAVVRGAVNESFVTGFRTVMLIGASLALASAGAAFASIGRKSRS